MSGGLKISFKATTYRILIASPSELEEERKEIPQAIYAWNALNSFDQKIVLLPVKWETDTVPEMGGDPQDIINKQIVEDCDILIGVFWYRIGTATSEEESGTVEEIKKFNKSGKPVMLYFSSKDIPKTKLDTDQYNRLQKFEKECRGDGIVDGYSIIPELKEKISRHLTKKIRNLHQKSTKEKERTKPPPRVELKTEKQKVHPLKQIENINSRYKLQWIIARRSSYSETADLIDIFERLNRELENYKVYMSVELNSVDSNYFNEIIARCEELKTTPDVDDPRGFTNYKRMGDKVFQMLEHFTTVKYEKYRK